MLVMPYKQGCHCTVGGSKEGSAQGSLPVSYSQEPVPDSFQNPPRAEPLQVGDPQTHRAWDAC